ncbi:hypothetical protein AWF22_10180 [Escherichia coli]|nr:hypothetical protein AWF22_10180 [Escherichia coli]
MPAFRRAKQQCELSVIDTGHPSCCQGEVPVANLLTLCPQLNPEVFMENQGCFVCAREGASMAGAKKMPALRRAKQ